MTQAIKRIFVHHAGDNERVFATLRLSRDQYDALRAAMHTPVGEVKIRFAHGVYMQPSGFGWYKLYTTNEFRATEKLQTAIQTIASIIHRVDHTARRAMQGIVTTSQPIVAFTEHGGYHHATIMREKPMGHKVEHARAPTPEKLQALAAKFARR